LTSFIISDNVQFVSEVWDNMHNWMDNPKKRKAAIKMLKEFKSMTHNQYWLTDDEELFIDQLTHTIESCC
jgi:hypothetical protein